MKKAIRTPYNVPLGLSNKSIIKERAAMFETCEPAIMQPFYKRSAIWRSVLSCFKLPRSCVLERLLHGFFWGPLSCVEKPPLFAQKFTADQGYHEEGVGVKKPKFLKKSMLQNCYYFQQCSEQGGSQGGVVSREVHKTVRMPRKWVHYCHHYFLK